MNGRRKRGLALALALWMILLACATSAEAPVDDTDGEYWPKVMNRCRTPEGWPGFAFDPEDDLLEVWFPRVHDQDCAIFRYQGEIWMLDCGDERRTERITILLQNLGITQIDRLINTHPHHDHLNGFYRVDEQAPVRELMVCFPEDATTHMVRAMEYVREKHIPVTFYGDGEVFAMGDGMVRFLCRQVAAEEEGMNDRSAQFMVSFGDCDLLMTADIQRRGEELLLGQLEDDSELKADILRYPHHGKEPLFDDYFKAVAPEMIIITNFEGCEAVKESDYYMFNRGWTAEYTMQGVIHLMTDGSHWLCETLPKDGE